MVTLKYHQATFDLLKVEPEIDPSAVAALDALEQRIGRDVPVALYELYSLKGAWEILRCNADNALMIEKLTLDPQAYPWIHLFADGMIIIRENQDCAIWACHLNCSDDPPVFISNDDYDEWAMCAPTFSDFVYGRVWDWCWMPRCSSLILWDDAAFAQDTLAYLQIGWTEEISSYNGFWRYMLNQTHYRFQRGDQHMRLETAPTSDIACRVYSDDVSALPDLLKALRPDVGYRERRRGNLITYYVGELTDERALAESIPF